MQKTALQAILLDPLSHCHPILASTGEDRPSWIIWSYQKNFILNSLSDNFEACHCSRTSLAVMKEGRYYSFSLGGFSVPNCTYHFWVAFCSRNLIYYEIVKHYVLNKRVLVSVLAHSKFWTTWEAANLLNNWRNILGCKTAVEKCSVFVYFIFLDLIVFGCQSFIKLFSVIWRTKQVKILPTQFLLNFQIWLSKDE